MKLIRVSQGFGSHPVCCCPISPLSTLPLAVPPTAPQVSGGEPSHRQQSQGGGAADSPGFLSPRCSSLPHAAPTKASPSPTAPASPIVGPLLLSLLWVEGLGFWGQGEQRGVRERCKGGCRGFFLRNPPFPSFMFFLNSCLAKWFNNQISLTQNPIS